MRGYELILHSGADQRVTLEALAAAADLQVELVERFVAFGLLEPISLENGRPWFDARALLRLRKIRRLREDLEINLAGIAVVLDQLDRIVALQRELTILRRSLGAREKVRT